jgi:decaprenylphospho-beta-D-erythro-pentofuranosid-2-ulose 2-reductase
MTAKGKRIVILGAASAMADSAARLWAADGASLALVGRNAQRLQTIAADLTARGAAQVTIHSLDCATADARAELAALAGQLGGLDIVLLAYGALGDQQAANRDSANLTELLQVNFTSAALWCQAAANLFEAQKSGTLLVIGSVAGDRGRQSNYAYGAAKAGLGVLVQGIAHRLAPSGARAVLIKPGFVDTPMTAHLPKGPLWAKPDALGRTIAKAADSGGPIVYAPGFWRLIMLAIRAAPAALFHRTRL